MTGGFYMKAELIKTAAVASLFLLGAATLQAQRAEAFRRPEPNQNAGTVAPGVREVILGKKSATKNAEKKAPREQAVSEWKSTVDYSGPRFGFTYLPQEIVDSLKGRNIDVDQAISQFGWQLEHEIHVTPDGPMVLNE